MKIKYNLCKSNRLLNANEFREVFNNRKSISTLKTFRIHYRLNNTENQTRIGLIVRKKIAKKAVDRNYMKRVIREWFRLNKSNLPIGDYVFFVKTHFDSDSFQKIQSELSFFYKRLNKLNYEISAN